MTTTTEPHFTDDMPLADARALLRELVEHGENCPVCTQFAKVYKRKIHASMAAALIAIYRQNMVAGSQWVEIAQVLPHRQVADAAKLRYWGLIEEEPSVRDDGSERTGFWRVTPRGIAFVRGNGYVKKYAKLYNGRCLGFDGDMVTIEECLGKKFNYNELMRGI